MCNKTFKTCQTWYDISNYYPLVGDSLVILLHLTNKCGHTDVSPDKTAVAEYVNTKLIVCMYLITNEIPDIKKD